jgi:predicted DNA-binding transcriptional regulator AlpA
MLHPSTMGKKPDYLPRRILRTPEAAIYLGLSVTTLEKWRCTGDGPPFVRIGRRALGYDREALDRFVAERSRTNTSDSGSTPDQTTQLKITSAARAADQAKASRSAPSPRPSRADKNERRRGRHAKRGPLESTGADHA